MFNAPLYALRFTLYALRSSLTDQIRRSSRSITACIAESWARWRYEKSFVNKLTDSLGEEFETESWLDYARDCKYINNSIHKKVLDEYEEVKENSYINY